MLGEWWLNNLYLLFIKIMPKGGVKIYVCIQLFFLIAMCKQTHISFSFLRIDYGALMSSKGYNHGMTIE